MWCQEGRWRLSGGTRGRLNVQQWWREHPEIRTDDKKALWGRGRGGRHTFQRTFTATFCDTCLPLWYRSTWASRSTRGSGCSVRSWFSVCWPVKSRGEKRRAVTLGKALQKVRWRWAQIKNSTWIIKNHTLIIYYKRPTENRLEALADNKARPCRLPAADAVWRRDRLNHWNPWASDPDGDTRRKKAHETNECRTEELLLVLTSAFQQHALAPTTPAHSIQSSHFSLIDASQQSLAPSPSLQEPGAWAPPPSRKSRKNPPAGPGSHGGGGVAGGGGKDERDRHLNRHQALQAGGAGVTLALRTVQWRELVALSYRRSNSNVPKEAVTKSTALYSNHTPPHHTQTHTHSCAFTVL